MSAYVQAFEGRGPRSSGEVRAHATAVLIGDVRLGDQVSLWPHAVVRADYGEIVIGDGSNVQDCAVIHNDHQHPAVIGKDCVIGHGAVVHGCTIGDRCLIGIGAIVLNGAQIGEESVIGAGALVPEGKILPPRSLVLGVPGKLLRSVSDEELRRTVVGAQHYREHAQSELPRLELKG
jgi:carbonic anhydrase/acetyltransferase-like protein (isoleucine patch superfamily)